MLVKRSDISSSATLLGDGYDAGVEVRRSGRLVLVLTSLLWRPLQKLLAGLKLPGHEAFNRLADKRGRGVIAQFGQIIGELS